MARFKTVAAAEFGAQDGFRCHDVEVQNLDSVVAQFHSYNWDFELFCQTTPTRQQCGVRHFVVEQRLLKLAPKLRTMVTHLKLGGVKTEPAFATALGLTDDPYDAILRMEPLSDAELLKLIDAVPHEF